MDEISVFSLTLILCVIVGINFGAGKRISDESNGREKRLEKVGSSSTALIGLFSLLSMGYLLAILWSVVLVSLKAVVIIGAIIFGSFIGRKLAASRQDVFTRYALLLSGILMPLIFHFLLP